MASQQAPVVDRIRIIPRPFDFLDRNIGASGEVFFDREANTLRVYSGKDRGGFEIARTDLTNISLDTLSSKGIALSDLSNISDEDFLSKAEASGFAGGGASVDISDTAPTEPEQGNIWFKSDTGVLYVYIQDVDSGQWVQPSVPLPSLQWDNIQGKPVVPESLLDLDITDGTSGQALVTDGAGNFRFATISGGAGGGGGVAYDQDLNTSNDVEFNTVTSTSFINNGTGNADITSASSITMTAPDGITVNSDIDIASPNIATINSATISAANISTLTASNLTITGETTIGESAEVLLVVDSPSGVTDYDVTTAAVFYSANSSANWTANFTNVPTTDNRSVSVAVVVEQGATGYMPTTMQIDSTAQTINWAGGFEPEGTPNGVDIVSFTLIRTGAAWTVLGSASSYE